jgi:hypothetical protein
MTGLSGVTGSRPVGSLSKQKDPMPLQDAAPTELNLKDVLLSVERTLIQSVLVACDWNQRKTAAALGVLPTTLSEKIHRLNIQPPKDRWSHENRLGGRRVVKTDTADATEPSVFVPVNDTGSATEADDSCPVCRRETARA